MWTRDDLELLRAQDRGDSPDPEVDGGAARLDFHTVAEPEPGEAWRASFTSMWFYTAAYFPATGRAEYRWPDDVMMTQSFDEAKERL